MRVRLSRPTSGSRISAFLLQEGFIAIFIAVQAGGSNGGSVPHPLMLEPSDGDFIDLGGKVAGMIRVSFNPKTKLLGDYLVYWSEDVDDAIRRVPLNVMSSIPTEDVFLRSVPAGKHRVKASVVKTRLGAIETAVPTHDSLANFEVLAEASAVVTMREFEDFVARYRPQPVMPWHRLPKGLDVKMDLSKGGSTARIPETWKWNVNVKLAAFAGTDSLPVKVWSEARPADILASVASQLGDPAIAESSVLMHKNGKPAPSLPSNHASFFAKQQEYTVIDLVEDSEEL